MGPDTPVALIPGGARGIGRGIALELARADWRVAICYRTSAADATSLENLGDGRIVAAQHDVSDPSQARAFVAGALERWGRIDALINAAGPFRQVDLLSETPDGWRSMFANNLDPVFYLSQAVAPAMIARGWGRIISFGMANADHLAAQPGITAHFIAKLGVVALTRSLARVLGRHGITVNAISPGFIDSGSLPTEDFARMTKRIPVGYVGHVDDVVGVVRFLLSDEARYVNGANIQVSGGWGL